MNTFLKPMHRNSIIAIAVAAALFAGCSSQPTKSEGALSARSRLVQLQSNSELATRAPLAIKEADVAVTAAEQPQKDKALETHLVFIANHKIDIAQARAESSLAVDQRKALGEQRDAMRLQARTNEADSANRRANAAQADATIQKRDADVARDARAIAQRDADVSRDAAAIAQRDASVSRDAAENAQRDAGAARDATNVAQRDADSAREATATAQRNARELQTQIDTLQAKVTDRGLVLTLGDVLFTSGTANLNSGANSHLGKLAAFLNKYPERNTTIEGYTDSIGSDDFNQGLSQRRAESVRTYLIGQGILARRLTASGKGESSPVGDNSTATGRQQNRRVEVIVENNLVSAR